MATDFRAKLALTFIRQTGVPKRIGNRNADGRDNRSNDPSILCTNFVNFSPVTPEIASLICVHV